MGAECKITIGCRIRVDHPPADLVTYAKQNLVIQNPDYIKKQRMGFWLGSTPRILRLYETDGDSLILPYGVCKEYPLRIYDSEIVSAFAEKHHVNYRCTVPLYDYQKSAVSAMIAAKTGILQSPAGSGKTQMGIALIAAHGCKAIWLTHTKDLLLQSRERAAQYMDDSLFGMITEGKVDIGAGITFATVQTMSNIDLEAHRYDWDVIVVDECHRVAGTPTAMTQFYKVLNNLAARHKYGLSATVHRADGMIRATTALLGPVAYCVPESAVEDKIMRVGIQRIDTGIGIDETCQNTDGTINYAQLINYLAKHTERNKQIADILAKNRQYSSLVLSDRIYHLESIMALLPDEMRQYAALVTGKMTTKSGKEERVKAIEDMRTGDKKYLFATYSLAKEGLDIPRLSRLYLATPQKDYAVITQSIGRIARTAPDKPAPVCFDFVDNSRFFENAYKKRKTTYRKNRCYFINDC